jgi:selenocysteine lyase
MHANNETGVIMPISQIGERLESVNEERRRNGHTRIYFHSDAAQTIGKIPVDVQELKVDYLTVVGHKVRLQCSECFIPVA